MELVEVFRRNISSFLKDDFHVSFPAAYILSGQDTLEGTRKALARLMTGRKPDLVLAVGMLSSLAALERKRLEKPVLAPYVPAFAMKKAGKNKGNLTFIDYLFYLDDDIAEFRKILPFRKLVMVFDQRDIRGVHDINRLVAIFEAKHDLELVIVPAGGSAQAVLNSIPDGTDAVITGPLWHFSKEEMEAFAQGLIRKRLPGFSVWERSQVEAGMLAGLDTRDKQEILARRAAVAALDILSGERPGSIKARFARTRRMTINMATARAIRKYPSVLMMTSSDIINGEDNTVTARLDIRTAVEEAVKANLSLKSAEKTVKVGEFAIKEARSELLPQIGISTGLRAIDQDRARVSGGMTPERAWTGNAGGSILLYSDEKWAGYTSEKYLQEARKEYRERVRLDVMYDTSVAYLKLLRARAFERIYKDNLKLTEANLERAQTRVATGAAGPDEVYRWQTKYASDRKDVLYRETNTMDAMEAVNRLLHRPLQEKFIPEETRLSNPLFIMGDRFFLRLMENPYHLKKFKQFAIKEALKLRPELGEYDAAIKARERKRTAAQRNYWLPEFSVDWNVDHYFAEDGSGRRDGSPLDDTDWSVGLFARFALFEGGRTVARSGRLGEEVARLHIRRDAKAEAIIQDVLAAINRTRASYPSITLSQEAVTAAKNNIDLVTNSYINGIKSIIDLLDAQNQFLNAELAATDAVYNFLIDFMGVERATGRFAIFMPDDERNRLLEEMKGEIMGK
jgi:outer membrane protein TolC